MLTPVWYVVIIDSDQYHSLDKNYHDCVFLNLRICSYRLAIAEVKHVPVLES